MNLCFSTPLIKLMMLPYVTPKESSKSVNVISCVTHYSGVITITMSSQITGASIVWSTAAQAQIKREHQSSVPLALAEVSSVITCFSHVSIIGCHLREMNGTPAHYHIYIWSTPLLINEDIFGERSFFVSPLPSAEALGCREFWFDPAIINVAIYAEHASHISAIFHYEDVMSWLNCFCICLFRLIPKEISKLWFLLALREGNPPVTGDFPHIGPIMLKTCLFV